MRKILFIGGPLHMETKEFDGPPAVELEHLVIAKPTLNPLETELRVVRYRLHKVRIDQSTPPRYPAAAAQLDFRVYVAEGDALDDYPEAALHLYQMWPEISSV